MGTETKGPHCPRCGGEMVRPSRRTRYGVPLWFARCDGCGFGAEEDMDDTDALAEARRRVRAELARQALELRAHTFGTPTMSTSASDFTLQKNMQCVLRCYIQIGENPLRLPGEDNA